MNHLGLLYQLLALRVRHLLMGGDQRGVVIAWETTGVSPRTQDRNASLLAFQIKLVFSTQLKNALLHFYRELLLINFLIAREFNLNLFIDILCIDVQSIPQHDNREDRSIHISPKN
jgi:hypothetical protein